MSLLAVSSCRSAFRHPPAPDAAIDPASRQATCGLKLGADDYLTKPFDMMELLARVESLLRRARTPIAPSAGTYAFGDVRVDFRRAEITLGDDPVELSALEFKLLSCFIEHRGELLSRERLLNEVWGYEATAYTRTVDVHVASLRPPIG